MAHTMLISRGQSYNYELPTVIHGFTGTYKLLAFSHSSTASIAAAHTDSGKANQINSRYWVSFVKTLLVAQFACRLFSAY